MVKDMKQKTMVISTLADMVTLENANTQVMVKAMKKMNKKLNRTRLFGVLSAGCMVLMYLRQYKQEEDIYRLSVRIKKMENKEGA